MSNERLRMKELISSTPSRGVFEIIEKDGSVSWVSDLILEQTGYSLSEISSMSLVNLSPDSLSSRVSATVSLSGDLIRTSIWPIVTTSGTVSWWYVNNESSDAISRWYSAQLMAHTNKIGEDFVRMCVIMDILNSHNDMNSRVNHHEKWVDEEISELKKFDRSVQDTLSSIKSQQNHVISLAKSAANGSMTVSANLKSLQKRVESGFSEQMTEILRLIRTDVIHDERINAFDMHMKEVAENAMKTMKNTADETAAEFKSKAVEAGKGLTRKVTVPVGVVAAVMSGIQWLINNWDKLSPHFPHF